MQRWIMTLGTGVALATLPIHAFAYGQDAGAAVLGGIVGGVVGGLIAAGAAPFPRYVAPAPLVVERYEPAPVIVESPYLAPAYDVGSYDGYRDHEWREHRWREQEWRAHHYLGQRWHDDED